MKLLPISIELRAESHVITLSLSICQVLGGAKSPLIAKVMVSEGASGCAKGEVTVMVWVANSPWQEMVVFLMLVVVPQQERVPLMGIVWLGDRSRAQVRVLGKVTWIVPFWGTECATTNVMSISLVWLITPPAKLMLSELSWPGVKVTCAEEEFPELSLAMAAVKGEVVMVEPGLTTPPTVMYILQTEEPEPNALVITRLLPLTAHPYPEMLASFTDKSRQAALEMRSVVYYGGNLREARSEADRGVVAHAVVARESSYWRSRQKQYVVVVPIWLLSMETSTELNVKQVICRHNTTRLRAITVKKRGVAF